MAAYAALVSLMNTMDHVQNDPRLSRYLDQKQVESLGEKVGFLLDFIETCHSHGGSREEVLESRIAFAAHAAEDVIESHAVDVLFVGSVFPERTSSIILSYALNAIEDIKRKGRKTISPWRLKLGLRKVIEKMDSIKKKVIEIKQIKGNAVNLTHSPSPTSSTAFMGAEKSKMVGFEDDLLQLMERLTGRQPNRQIIPIVGMGGIGKTTLARNVYENPLIVQHFDICCWVTVSQEYSVRKVLLELLSCQIKPTSEMDGKDEAQLGEQLYKSLFGMRYLIVLDDMWSIDAWDKINRFLPNNNNRSQVVVTTRLLEVANHFGSSRHMMSFLDEDKSWELFCQKAFGKEGNCPLELEGIGKEIVKECKGLPLSIVVIGGLLGKSINTREYWEKFAKEKKSILNTRGGEESLDILSLSYNHLPAHLKPCFLYMGVFPEDHVISVSKLIKLWVAEGFIKPNSTQSLEESAEGYLKDLVDRNLVLVRRLGSTGKMKTCTIHDLLRELCLKVAQKEKFLCVTSVLDIPLGIDKGQRIRIFHAFVSTLLDGSNLVSKGGKLSLKVLNVVDSDSSLRDIFEQINLRYVCKSYSFRALPPSISWLWNLQTLIIRGKEYFTAPREIWMMLQLRHLEFDKIYLLEPPPSGDLQTTLPNLQTFFKILNLELSEELCMTIPNVKKLKLKYRDFSAEKYHLYNLDLLHKLESLSCFFQEAPKWGDLVQNLKFPSSLKKLSLRNSNLRWEDLTVIGSLPHLEVLKLMGLNSIVGNEWNPVEGEFIRLKFLGIYYCYDLMHWNADRSHFPVLENLVLEGLSKLDEIPFDIGEIPTLGLIELDGCSESAAISAVRILEEQESLGNEGLQVRVKLLDNAKVERFGEKVKEEFGSFTSGNFQLRAINRFS
ncbi:hypothetical protein ABFS82_04G169800 [Erythranthe guttata]|uniref:putative late blight resistance protein homolog R1B-17 n=1 Tax=Erythranthe guttata TaxID=4155 RepID=UPI00064D7889|nr:PREDICTED: putative late blight resistance protein homolog R1B-17 [Erythranthe guttata]|eukprot:XP_012829311.1 PREDICTED: putative late blight resistance protein homolog R1B-17 [Erythranthe guttata]